MKGTAKTFAVKKVISALRTLGLFQVRKGNGTGHEIWVNEKGKRVHPVLRYRDMPFPHIYTLGFELEAQQICSRHFFIQSVKFA